MGEYLKLGRLSFLFCIALYEHCYDVQKRISLENKSHYTHKEDPACFIGFWCFFLCTSIFLLYRSETSNWVHGKTRCGLMTAISKADEVDTRLTRLCFNINKELKCINGKIRKPCTFSNSWRCLRPWENPSRSSPHHCWLYCKDWHNAVKARQFAELLSFGQKVATLTEYLLGILPPWRDGAFAAESQWGHRPAGASPAKKRLCVSVALQRWRSQRPRPPHSKWSSLSLFIFLIYHSFKSAKENCMLKVQNLKPGITTRYNANYIICNAQMSF